MKWECEENERRGQSEARRRAGSIKKVRLEVKEKSRDDVELDDRK